jgi:hypothetical protein
VLWWRRRRADAPPPEPASGREELRSRYEPTLAVERLEAGVSGLSRPREWDAVVFAEAPAIHDDPVVFVALPEGGLLVEVGDEPGDLTPLAEAVERERPRPYRAQAVRKDGDRFAVGVVGIDVAELPETEGDALTLTVRDGGRDLTVDGELRSGSSQALERLGAGVAKSFVVRAERLQGDLFEVRVDRL